MISWTDDAWDDYVYWQTQDKKTLRRINALIKDCKRSPFLKTYPNLPKGKFSV